MVINFLGPSKILSIWNMRMSTGFLLPQCHNNLQNKILNSDGGQFGFIELQTCGFLELYEKLYIWWWIVPTINNRITTTTASQLTTSIIYYRALMNIFHCIKSKLSNIPVTGGNVTSYKGKYHQLQGVISPVTGENVTSYKGNVISYRGKYHQFQGKFMQNFHEEIIIWFSSTKQSCISQTVYTGNKNVDTCIYLMHRTCCLKNAHNQQIGK